MHSERSLRRPEPPLPRSRSLRYSHYESLSNLQLKTNLPRAFCGEEGTPSRLKKSLMHRWKLSIEVKTTLYRLHFCRLCTKFSRQLGQSSGGKTPDETLQKARHQPPKPSRAELLYYSRSWTSLHRLFLKTRSASHLRFNQYSQNGRSTKLSRLYLECHASFAIHPLPGP